MNLNNIIKRLPKVDLHRHLEATIRLDTAREVAKQFHLDLPWRDDEAFRRAFQYSPGDKPFFYHFHKEIWVTEDVIRRVAAEAIEDAEGDGIVYLELRFSTDHYRKHYNHSPQRVVDILSDVVTKARIKTNLIMSISGGRDQTYEYVKPNLDILRHYADASPVPIVGVDLSTGWYKAKSLFQKVLHEVQQLDCFPMTVHAGEGMGASDVKTAIEEYGASRIGHGFGAWYDQDVLDLVIHRRVPLEICLTSNLHTGAIARLEEHPARKLLKAGAIVTLNTDDPSISGDLTMSDEYNVAVEVLGFSIAELRQVLENSIGAAFLPLDEKQELWREASDFFDSIVKRAETSDNTV